MPPGRGKGKDKERRKGGDVDSFFWADSTLVDCYMILIQGSGSQEAEFSEHTIGPPRGCGHIFPSFLQDVNCKV